MKWRIRTLVLMGLLVAMSVILTRFSIMLTPVIRLGFREVPIILSGILFGPLAGLITGVAADLIGFLISSQGAFFIGFTVSAALTGLIPGLVFLKQKEKFSIGKIILAVVLYEVLVALLLNTEWLSLMYGKVFFEILPARAIKIAIMAVLEIILLAGIIKTLDKTGITK